MQYGSCTCLDNHHQLANLAALCCNWSQQRLLPPSYQGQAGLCDENHSLRPRQAKKSLLEFTDFQAAQHQRQTTDGA